MAFEENIPKELFEKESGHYLGKPARFEDKIIARRLRLVRQVPDFVGKQYTLLDIGCGNGASMFGLSSDMKECVGVEVTDKHLEDFYDYKQKHSITNCTCNIINVEVESPKRQFDRIISFEVIEHLTKESSLKFYYDSLKEGGMMVISVPNKWWIFETHGAKLPLLPWNRVPFFSWLPRFVHERYANARIYTKSRIKQLLETHGFVVKEAQYIMAPLDVLPEGRFKRFFTTYFFNKDTTTWAIKSTSILVLATKPPK